MAVPLLERLFGPGYRLAARMSGNVSPQGLTKLTPLSGHDLSGQIANADAQQRTRVLADQLRQVMAEYGMPGEVVQGSSDDELTQLIETLMQRRRPQEATL